jgi:aconitate hydratase
VPVSNVKKDFNECIPNKAGFKGFGVTPDKINLNHSFKFKGEEHKLHHGSIVLAAITSCTNTSNPDVMVAAGLVAKRAVEKGLKYFFRYLELRVISRPVYLQVLVWSLSISTNPA